jgi:hypothetical protein
MEKVFTVISSPINSGGIILLGITPVARLAPEREDMGGVINHPLRSSPSSQIASDHTYRTIYHQDL